MAQLNLPFPAKLPEDFSESELLRRHDPLRTTDRLFSWDLERVRAARDAQQRGDFRVSTSLAEAMKTDPQIFGALLNRICPHRRLPRTWSSLNKRVTTEAERLFKRDGVAISSQAVADMFEFTVQLGVHVSQNVWTARDDGSRIDPVLEPWPMHTVWYDHNLRTLRTMTTRGLENITHGDGKWVVSCLHGGTPWEWGTIKAAALPWPTRAFHVRDRSLNSETHGEGKFLGTLPERTQLKSPEGQAFKDLVAGLRSRRSGGVIPSGASVEILEATSQMWQIFSEAIKAIDTDIARAYLGQDGSMVNEGGNYIKAAQLVGVRYDLVEGDIVAITSALTTGTLRPWSIMNFGRDLDVITSWQLPDPDVQLERESFGGRTLAFNKAIKAYKGNGFIVDQATVDRLAVSYGLEPPKLMPEVVERRPAPAPPPAEDETDSDEPGDEDETE